MSTKKMVQTRILGVDGPKPTQSEAIPPPVLELEPRLEELKEVVSRMLGYIVTHTDHAGEGDELYNELTPKLLKRTP